LLPIFFNGCANPGSRQALVVKEAFLQDQQLSEAMAFISCCLLKLQVLLNLQVPPNLRVQPSWDPAHVFNGTTTPKRAPGRPKRRWDDFLNDFAHEVFHTKWWETDPQAWSAKRQDFIDYVSLCS